MLYDEKEYLIVISGKDKTIDITYLNETELSIDICFKSKEQIYTYRDRSKISIYKSPKTIDMNSYRIHVGTRCLNSMIKVLDFGIYVKVFYSNGQKYMYRNDVLPIFQTSSPKYYAAV